MRLFNKQKQKTNIDPLHILDHALPAQTSAAGSDIIAGNDNSLIGNNQFSKKSLIIIATIFALLGAYLVFRSFAAVTVTTINNSNVGTGTNQFEFVGTWQAGNDTLAYNGDEHYSNVAGAYYQVRFNGTQAKIYTTTDPKHGIAAVSVDGGAEVEMDTYAPLPRANGVLKYTSPVLAEGPHILKVRVKGTKNPAAADTYIVADRVEVTSSSAQVPTGCTQAPFPSRLKASGRNLVDENNCVMPKLKGFNIHAAPSSDANFVWDNSHFADIRNNGGGVLRTVVQWNAYEAQQGVISPANLATLDKHIARAQRNGLYVILDLHLNTGNIPGWATDGSYSQGEETAYYTKNGQNITQTLAQRYSVPRTADGITINPKTILGFNLNEPPQDGATINGNNSIPTFEAQQRQMISWFRSAGAPDWIGFVTLAYANQKPYLTAPRVSANPDAYDNIGPGIPGGNVVFDAHDYFVYNDLTDPNTDSRWDHGVLHDTRSAPGAHWLSILDPHNFPSDPVLANRAKSQMKAFLKPFDTYATAAQMPLMIGEFGWNGDRTGGTGKSGYYAAKREAMNCMSPAIEIHWIYATSYTQDQWSSKAAPATWDPEVLAWLKDTNNTCTSTSSVDTTQPTLSWIKPADATTVSGYMFEAANSGPSGPCEVNASDNVGVTKVRFYVDDILLNEETGAPYNCKFDTTQVGNGNHTLKAEVYDGASNMFSATRTVNVQNGSLPLSIDGEWKLLWEDNFDGTTLSSAWQPYSGSGHAGNGLRQPAAITVNNGELIITAKNIDTNGDGIVDKVSSGGMSNKTNTKYGRFEARVRTEVDPSGIMSGVILTWPQTNNWPAEGENDFYETGTDPDTVTPRNPFSSFIHYPVPPPLPYPTPQAYVRHDADGTQYHDMRMDWTPDYIKIYRDGILIKTINESDNHTINHTINGVTTPVTYTDNIPDFSHHMTIQLDATKPNLLTKDGSTNATVKMYVDRVAHYELVNTPPSDTTPPAFPTGAVLTATPASPTQINLSWPSATDNIGVTKYELLRKGPADTSYNVIASPTTTNYPSNGLSASSTYSYQVRALDAANNPSAILSASATTPAPPADSTPPPAPTLSANAVSSNQINLAWNHVTDPESGMKEYRVFRNGTQIKTIAATTCAANCTFGDANSLTVNTPYEYYVKAVNNSTSTTNSADSNKVTITLTMPSVVLKLINADTDQVISSMTNDMAIDLKNGRNLNIDASLPAGSLFESVRFEDTFSVDGQSSQTTSKIESFPPYAIGEDAGTGSTDYFPWTPALGSHTMTVTAFELDGAGGTVQASTTIKFTVNDTTPSDTQAPIVSVAPPAGSLQEPTGTCDSSTPRVCKDGIIFTASATDNVAVTKVDFLIDNSYKFSDSDASNGHVYTIDSKTLGNGAHTVKAIAYDAANNGPTTSASVIFNVLNSDTTPPASPASINAAVTQPTTTSAAKIDLSWPAGVDSGNQASGIKGYYVYRDGIVINPKDAAGNTQLITGLSFTDTGTPAGSSVAVGTHTYSVRSVDNAGLTSTDTAPTKVITINTPSDTAKPTAPTSLIAQASSSTQINLSWTASDDTGGSGLAGYNVYRGTSPDPAAITTKVNANMITPAAASCSTTAACSFGDSTGLIPNTTYYYVVVAIDGAGNQSDKTAVVSAKTLPDSSVPVLTITSPAAGDVSGHVRISAQAADNVAVTIMEIYIDNKPYAISTNSSSIATNWNTNPSKWNGSHTITIRAKDSSGNTTEKSVNVTVR